MKKLLLSAFVAFAMLASTKTLAQQGFGTNTPDKSAAVDIISSQRGLLIPRLNLTALNVALPVANPAQSLLVFNQATSPGTVAPADAVTPGFYYWDTNRWVRIISTGSEKSTVVAAGKNVQVDTAVTGLTTTYTVSVAEGTQGQVLVTVLNPTTNQSESQWVDASEFINGVNGISVTPVTNPTTGVVTNEISLGGSLTKPTVVTTTATNTLAIDGLTVLDNATFDPATQNIVVMGPDGILKEVSSRVLIEDAIAADNLAAKTLSSAGGIITVNGTAAAINTVLKDVELGIANKSIGAEKLNPGSSTPGQIATVVETTPGDATTKVVQYQDPSTAIGKTLTTDNIIGVGADATAASATTANSLNGAVLTPTYLKIKDNSITALQIGTGAVGTDELAADAVTNAKLADNAVQTENILDGTIANADLATQSVTADKMQSKNTAAGTNALLGTVPVADGVGGVTYQTVASAVGENLTTDGKIVIGSTNATTLADAVLVPTELKIAANSITSADIKDGTIQASDLKAPGSTTDSNIGTPGQVLVTDVTTGEVKWIAQSALANKDNYSFAAPLSKDAGTPNTTTGGTDYTVSIATASATTLGVVKQSAATGEEITIGTDGSLSVNEANVNVGLDSNNTPQGDVSGTLSNLTVGAIQGIPVSADDPTATNNMLVFQNGRWEPSTVATAAGKTLTGAGITVTAGTAAGAGTSLAQSVLADVTLGIADNAITSIKIADGAVSNVDVAPLAISPDKMTTYTSANGTATPASVGTVATAGPNGTVVFNTINTNVLVDNGISKATDGDIILGGTLNEAATTIITGGGANTLAVQGLIVPTAATTEIMYAEGTTGVLRKAVRSISQYVEASQVVSAITGYNDFVQEINITAKIVSGDINVTLPTATATNRGQVVNVKIVNIAEVADYVNILVGSTTLTYGALPYQSWIIKSDGSTWEIVGRN